MPQRESQKDVDAYLRLNGKEGRVTKYQGKDKEPLDVGSVQEGDLAQIIIEKYEHAKKIKTKAVFVMNFVKPDGSMGVEHFNMSSLGCLFTLLNTLASVDNLLYRTVGFEFWTKELESGMTSCNVGLSVDGLRVEKDDARGFKWKFPYDKIRPIVEAEGEEQFNMLTSFVKKNIQPLFEKGPSKDAVDYEKLKLAKIISDQNPKIDERPKMMEEMAAADELMGDEESIFADDDDDDLPF